MTMQANQANICFEEDDYTFEKPRWLAQLEDGRVVLQDDERPGCSPPSAWLRLKNYVEANNLKIKNVWLQFRSNVVKSLPEDADGYFFINGAAYVIGAASSIGFYVIGWLENGIVHTQKWKIPELTLFDEGSRSISEASQSLISNTKISK